MHSTDATDSTEPAPTEPRTLIDLRSGEVIPTDVPRRAFKPSEVAEQLGCSESYVYTLIRTNEMRAVKLAGRLTVLDEDLDAFIEKLKAEREQATRGVS